MKPKAVLSWLSYLTQENYNDRIDNYIKSLLSLRSFPSNVKIVIVDNSDIDAPLQLRDKYLPRAEVFRAKNQWCDVAVHYVGCEVAFNGGTTYNDTKNALNYFAYSYDDFVFYDTNFFEPSIEFMEKNNDVACIRLPEYDTSNVSFYDTAHTPKTTNPEAVRHNNTPGDKAVQHLGPFEHSGKSFYKNKWRPISRPTLWHVGDFMKIIGKPEACPTLQQFEQYMYNRADATIEWCSGFLDKGVCRTFPQSTSLRIQQGLGITKSSPVVNIDRLCEEIRKKENWK